ncbi:MAG TPA: hypothetical protein VFC33_16550 [Acidimicrobiia bacterium]|nr:hypothetical protein [Acidimicrobiia bacterium]
MPDPVVFSACEPSDASRAYGLGLVSLPVELGREERAPRWKGR